MKIHKLIKQLVPVLIMAFCMVCAPTVYARDAETVVIPTDVTQAREGCTLVGLQGDYAGDVKEAIARLNEIRLEACQNGYPDPRDSSRNLTLDDYVPIQWSSDLEYIARIRAAEGSIYTMHERPNGTGLSSLKSPNGVVASNEVLAWQSWTGTLVDAIDNWYTEKTAWVNKSGGVTGHYTSMINPGYRYAGIANFNSDSGLWRSSAAGKFSSKEGLDTTEGAAVKNCIQVIEVKNEYLGSITLKEQQETEEDEFYWDEDSPAEETLKVGDTKKYDFVQNVTIGEDKSQVYVLGNITWATSDAGVASVDQYGTVKITGYGTAVITARSDTGAVASVTLTVKLNMEKVSIKSVTAGKKQFTAKWGKISNATGYQLQYSTKRNFKSKVKSKTIKGKSKTTLTIKKLKSKKKYYVRIRAYKTVNGKQYFSDWSKVKTVKVK